MQDKKKEKEAFSICLEKIRTHNLEMKLIEAEYTFDNNKIVFYFTADGRIDFRELVNSINGYTLKNSGSYPLRTYGHFDNQTIKKRKTLYKKRKKE